MNERFTQLKCVISMPYEGGYEAGQLNARMAEHYRLPVNIDY